MTGENKKRIYLSSPTMHGEEKQFVKEAFDTNWIAPLGPHVNAFEEEVAAAAGSKSGAALSSGTAAIHLALKLAGVKAGDVVPVSDLTFSASCNPIVYEKAVPVFIDSEPDTWNMCPEALERALKMYPHIKAVVCVHLYGVPAKMEELTGLCERYGVTLIEDAAESLGAVYRGRMTGTFGKFGIYSFNGNKIITTSGGGMLISDDEEAVARARFLATQARDPARHYQHSEIGYNYRMSNVVAGIGRGQLPHLKEHIARKKAIYEQYKTAFSDIPQITMNPQNPQGEGNYWLSCLTLEEDCDVTPAQIMDALEAENIECRPIWKPMHLQPVFRQYDFITLRGKGEGLGADIFHRGLCLPSDIKNTPEDMENIIRIVRRQFRL